MRPEQAIRGTHRRSPAARSGAPLPFVYEVLAEVGFSTEQADALGETGVLGTLPTQ